MHRFILLSLTALVVLVFATPVSAEPVDGLEYQSESGWQPYDPEVLTDVAEPRCVRLRNYWCLKQPNGATWNGSIGADADNHARFADPAWSARAFIRTMRTYRFVHNLRSAREIFGRYAPSSDCIGSLPRDPVTGLCPKGENQPVVYARQVAGQLGKDLHDDLGLFDENGRLVQSVAVPLARAVATYELGARWRVTDDLVIKGIERSGLPTTEGANASE